MTPEFRLSIDALRFVGGAGGRSCGVALTCEESGLSPAEFTAEMT
jgi:hypothetical protein